MASPLQLVYSLFGAYLQVVTLRHFCIIYHSTVLAVHLDLQAHEVAAKVREAHLMPLLILWLGAHALLVSARVGHELVIMFPGGVRVVNVRLGELERLVEDDQLFLALVPSAGSRA